MVARRHGKRKPAVKAAAKPHRDGVAARLNFFAAAEHQWNRVEQPTCALTEENLP
jgi:hypothetical protein